MVSDPERLQEEREFSRKNREKFASISNAEGGSITGMGSYSGNYENPTSSFMSASKDKKKNKKKSKENSKSKKHKKKKKKKASSSSEDSSSDSDNSSDDESSSEDEREKKKKSKSKKKKSKHEKPNEEDKQDDIFGLMMEDSSQPEKQSNPTMDVFGENFSAPQNNQTQDLFGSQAPQAFSLPKPPQKASPMDFPSVGQQNVGIDAFASMAAMSQAPPPQSQSFGTYQQTSTTSNLDAAFGQMNLNQQTQFQPQSTAGFGVAQNTFGSNTQFQSSGAPQQFQQTSGFGGATGMAPPSSDIFGTASTTPGGYGVSAASTGGFGVQQPPTSSAFGSQPTTQAPQKDNGFGAFQSSEKDAWSMGEGLGKYY